MFFCDYLNVSQQYPAGLYPDFLGGRMVSIDGACGLSRKRLTDSDTGEIKEAWAITVEDQADEVDIEFSTPKFGEGRGSYETTLNIRMVDGKLEVRGNPSAFGRLDNLFGVGLDEGIAIYNGVLAGLGLPPFTEGVERLLDWDKDAQDYKREYTGACISRADMTVNQSVGMGRVRDYNRWLASQKVSRSSPNDADLQKFQQWDFGTVYTSTSKLWMLVKHYDKSAALEDVTLPNYMKKLRNAASVGRIQRDQVHALFKEAEDYLLKLAEWCAEVGIVRSEWSIKSRWFSQHSGSGFWKPGVCESNLIDMVTAEREKITMRAIVYQQDSYDSLSASEYRALDKWKKGVPLKASLGGDMPDPTFYRVRSAVLKKTGHDIASRPLVNQAKTDFRPVYFQVKPLSVSDAPIWYQRPSSQSAFLLAA